MDLKINILAELADKVSAPFRNMKKASDDMGAALRGTTAQVRELEKTAGSVEAWRRLKTEARANASALADAQEKAQALGRALAEAGGGSRKQQREFKAAAAEVNRLEAAQSRITSETGIMRGRLAEAGIDTRNLSAGMRKLKTDLDAARAAAMREGNALDALKTKMQAVDKARAKMEGTKATAGKLALGGGLAMAGGGGIAAGLDRALVNPAADMQHNLAAYGLTAGLDKDALEAQRARLVAASANVNVSAPDLLAGQSIMVGKGLKSEDALASIETIGRAVTATGAEMTDMSTLAYSVMDGLKVPQKELAASLDIMAKAGDEGGFELKDMATYFPLLTQSAYSLGMQGNKSVASLSAALQVATKGAATTSEAANNTANFFKALTGKEAVKNFAEKGIDIKAALQAGLMKGEDPIETMLKTVGQGIGVDLEKEVSAAMADGLDPKAAAERVSGRFNLAELFGDAQAQNFLAPLLANMPEYRRIRDAALNSAGTVDQKFTTMMGTLKEQRNGLSIDTDNALEGIGHTMLPVMTSVTIGLRGIVQGITAFSQANPRLTATLAIVATGLAVLVAIGGALTLGLGALLGPFAMVRYGLTLIGLSSGIASGGLATLGTMASGAFGMLAAGARAASLALLTTPVGWLLMGIAAIAGAAALIYVYWSDIKQFFADLWDGAGKSFGGFLDLVMTGLQMLTNPLAAIGSILARVVGDDVMGKLSSGLGDGIKTAAAAPVKVASTAAIAATVAASPVAAAAPPPPGMGGNTYAITIDMRGAVGGDDLEKRIKDAVRDAIGQIERQKATDTRARLYDPET